MIDKFKKTYHLLAQEGGTPDFPPPSNGFNIPITNPLSVDNIPDLIKKLLEIMVQVGLPLVAIFIIYTGFLFVTARGNETKLEAAKKAFFWTIIGAAIVLGAFVISTVIKTTVKGLG